MPLSTEGAAPPAADATSPLWRRPGAAPRFALRARGVTPALLLLGWLLRAAGGRALGRLGDFGRTAERREARRQAREARAAARLARVLGRLKGPYAKLGQFAAIRYDVLGPSARAALASLRDRVPPIPFAGVRRLVEAELGAPLEERFAAFERDPLGAASIAQAHAATLRDGTPVVVKVQYPWLEASLERDLALLRRLLRRVTRAPDAGRLFEEFARGIREELDFRREAEVAGTIAENLREEPAVVVPRVVASHSTRRVLTVERHAAVPVTDAAALRRLRIDPREVVEILVRAYARQVFVDGLFHADPHPGNLFVLEDARAGPRVLFVDFGLSRRLSPELSDEMRAAILAILSGDVDAFVTGMERMDMIAKGAREGVRDAVARMFERLRGEAGSPLGLGADRVLALKDEAKALLEETPGVQLPNDLLLYAKTLSYLFALAAEIAPDADPMPQTIPWLLRFLAGSGRRGAAERLGRGSAPPTPRPGVGGGGPGGG